MEQAKPSKWGLPKEQINNNFRRVQTLTKWTLMATQEQGRQISPNYASAHYITGQNSSLDLALVPYYYHFWLITSIWKDARTAQAEWMTGFTLEKDPCARKIFRDFFTRVKCTKHEIAQMDERTRVRRHTQNMQDLLNGLFKIDAAIFLCILARMDR